MFVGKSINFKPFKKNVDIFGIVKSTFFACYRENGNKFKLYNWKKRGDANIEWKR